MRKVLMELKNQGIQFLTGLLSSISKNAISTDEITCFCKKFQSDFAANNSNRKSFHLQATFTRDVVAIFQKTISFPQYRFLHAHFQT